MDPELRSWTQRQEAATQEIAADQKRLADAVTLLSREVANIAMMLAPRASEGESPLEQLLAQLAAQGKEQLTLLRNLGQAVGRIERGQTGTGGPSSPRANGNDRGPPS